jgi:signal transduction histidine kinase/CheY-like chemotaxis protein
VKVAGEKRASGVEGLLAVVPLPLALHTSGRVLFANQLADRLVGVSLLGVDLAELATAAGREAIREFLAAEQPGRAAVELSTPSGSVEVEIEQGEKVDFAGRRVAPLFFTDLAAKKALEQEEVLSARLASLGAVAASVAHELNNPLAIVLAQVELAQRHTSEPGARETLDAIREGLERLRGVVVDLKAFSKGDADSVRMVDVREAVSRVLRMADKSVLAKAQLVEELAPVPEVIGNEGRLSQVFLNLLVNAVEALPEDRPKSENLVRIRTRLGADGRVEVAIADNGIGLDPELVDRVFDSFFTTKGARSGTGLGLAICRRIVQEHGGEVFARTTVEPPFKTEFVTVLPVARGVTPTPVPLGRPARTRRRVLVVDDETRLLRALSGLLGQWHEVHTAESGERALAVLQERPFDVILCDLMMQGIDGMQLHELVKSAHPGLEDRMIFMTGGAFTKRAKTFLAPLKDRRLDKPFELETLLAMIDSVAPR